MDTHPTSDRPNPFFCAAASRQAAEPLIGTAPHYQTYIFIECPFPWTANAFESKAIPQNLRTLIKSLERTCLPVRFLLINRGRTDSDRPTVLIYQLPTDEFSQGYQRWSWQVDRLEQVAPLIRCYLSGQVAVPEVTRHSTRDLFVCVHGSHDKCCAKYGIPFYRAAIATIREHMALSADSESIQLWQVSHFGGHRFAPTLLDLPTGRYYGRLDQDSLRLLLQRSGDIQALTQIYRGWGILPAPLQVLEQQLLLHYGWDCFNYKIAHRIAAQSAEIGWLQVEVSIEQPHGRIQYYHAELAKDESQTICVQGSCHAASPSEFVQYRIQALHQREVQPMQLSA